MRARAITTVASALLAVSLAGAPALAAETTTVPESLTVRPPAEFTVEVFLGDITYGPPEGVEPGAAPVQALPNPATQGRVMSVGAGVIVDIDLQASDFTGTGLPDLNKNIRDLSPWTTHPNVWPASKMTWHPDVAVTQEWFLSSVINNLSPLVSTAGFPCDDASTSHWCPFAVSSRVTIPADAVPGDYAGTLEWTITGHY